MPVVFPRSEDGSRNTSARAVNGGSFTQSGAPMALPQVDSAFRWSREAWGYALRCRPLEAVAQHLFTTRQLVLRPQAAAGSAGTSAAPMAVVHEAWMQAVDSIGGDVAHLMRVKQVHGRTIRVLKTGISIAEESVARPEADAIVSNQTELVLAVQ